MEEIPSKHSLEAGLTLKACEFTIGNLKPPGISLQHLTLFKAPEQRKKASFSWEGGRSGEPHAQRHAAKTAEHETISSDTLQADRYPVYPQRIHSILSLTHKIPLVSYIMLFNLSDEREKLPLSKSMFLQVSFIPFPLNMQHYYQK